MEPWTANDERPRLRPSESSAGWWIVVLLVVFLAAGAGYYFWHEQATPPPPLPASGPASAPAPQAAAQPAAPALDPALAEPAKGLPTLENSDSLMRDTVVGLVGRKAFEEWVYPAQLVRRIVATVDNLPRETAPRRVMPLEPVPGGFSVVRAEEITIAAANSARYAPYVRVFETLDSHVLVKRYIESYPLFQRAYEQLGFPDRKFHPRLLEAIDDLLAAPELTEPARLVQPKVLYRFADPELEQLSAGQKIMLRMGPENAAKVKAKLREIRRLLR